jgi:hypothetical protein
MALPPPIKLLYPTLKGLGLGFTFKGTDIKLSPFNEL